MTKNMNVPPSRGPLDHSVREQIVEAALSISAITATKTTVAELAKSIGFQSPISISFDSKQAIGEVICANRLSLIVEAIDAQCRCAVSQRKLRRLFGALTGGERTVFHDRKLYDISRRRRAG